VSRSKSKGIETLEKALTEIGRRLAGLTIKEGVKMASSVADVVERVLPSNAPLLVNPIETLEELVDEFAKRACFSALLLQTLPTYPPNAPIISKRVITRASLSRDHGVKSLHRQLEIHCGLNVECSGKGI
jgi:hypothetical protein